jgi:hypothetical protein
MIHIPPYLRLGEDEGFLDISGLRANGADRIKRQDEVEMNMGRG